MASISASLERNAACPGFARTQFRLNYAFVVEASGANTTLEAYPSQITANGTAQAVITIQARDDDDSPVPGGGDEIILSTTAGTLSSSVTDHGDGTYTAILTASTSVETATITGTINGEIIGDSATVDFVTDTGDLNEPDPDASRVTVVPSTVPADGSAQATVTVELRNAFGNPIISGGDNVTVAATSGTVSAVTDNGDGTYTVTVIAPGTPGEAIITAGVNGNPIGDQAVLVFADTGRTLPSGPESVLDVDPAALPADGSSVAIVTVEARDSSGTPLIDGGDTVEIFTTAGTLGASVVDNGDGTYTTTLTAPLAAAIAEVSGTINGEPIGNVVQVMFGDDGIFADRFESSP